MERIGLISQSFEDSIYTFSLKFKDPELEEAYVEAQTSLKFVSATNKRFLIFILAGHFSFHIMDISSALGINPDYTFKLETWIVYGFLPLIILMEMVFYFCRSMASARGIPITILGAFVLFHNNFDTFESEMFYPYTGTE